MKVLFKESLFIAMLAIITISFSSCSDSNDSGDNGVLTGTQKEMRTIAQQYVSNAVNTTYEKLATETASLYDQILAAKTKFIADPRSLSQSELDKICETFKTARAYYESSEAFLYGAATDFGIDPHVDTWPLDVEGLATALTNKGQLEALSGDNNAAIAYATGKLGQELLGFHGIEFVIFRNGKNRNIESLKKEEDNENFTKINAHVTVKEELIYATAVAGDLRDKCWQLEVAWNENAPQSHKERIEELELPTTVAGGTYSYGKNMQIAGNAGSSYATWEEVMTTIVKAGCENICDEVANTKIGNPYSGKDKNYIESPYSERSFIDFKDDIKGIEASLYGGIESNRDKNKSIISFMQKHNYSGLTTLETDLKASISALETCQDKLSGGFVNNVNNPLVGVAQKALQALDDDLNNAADWLSKQ
jgi:hypothetical protein